VQHSYRVLSPLLLCSMAHGWYGMIAERCYYCLSDLPHHAACMQTLAACSHD
jgi:hypothetical protein